MKNPIRKLNSHHLTLKPDQIKKKPMVVKQASKAKLDSLNDLVENNYKV